MNLKNVHRNLGVIVVIMIISCSLSSFGQKRPQRKAIRDKIEAQEVAFITREVNLTPEEAKVFWPVYNEFKDKKKALNKEFMDKNKSLLENKDNLTEKEYKDLADAQLMQEQRQLDLKKEYHNRFMSMLPASKVVKLYETDRQFKKMLLKRLGERKGKGGDNKPPRPE